MTINHRVSQLTEGQKSKVLHIIVEGGEISSALDIVEQEPSPHMRDAIELLHLHKCDGTNCPIDTGDDLDLDLDWNDPHISSLLGALRGLAEDHAPELLDNAILDCVRVAINAVNIVEARVSADERSLSKSILKYLLV